MIDRSDPARDPRVMEASVLPVVARPSAGIPLWAIVGAALMLGLMLFLVLDSRRRAMTSPAVRPRPSEFAAGSSAPPPPLFLPVEPPPPLAALSAPQPVQPAITQQQPQTPPVYRAPSPVPPAQVYPSQSWTNAAPAAPAPATRVAQDAALVIDTTAGGARNAEATAAAGASAEGQSAAAPVAGSRASAGVLANRSTTVPQGTLISAVLETALDSTRPGLARAIVGRDIRGFDGSRVLIPRGSRLIGEYGSQTEAGQKRMLVNWIRLIRPDGVTIAIGSPATDTLGRGGISASVNSHFFERFAGAILQSVLDVGVALAARSSNSNLILALPGSFQGGSARSTSADQVRPTLKVKAATSISIFVARDLDFTGAERR